MMIRISLTRVLLGAIFCLCVAFPSTSPLTTLVEAAGHLEFFSGAQFNGNCLLQLPNTDLLVCNLDYGNILRVTTSGQLSVWADHLNASEIHYRPQLDPDHIYVFSSTYNFREHADNVTVISIANPSVRRLVAFTHYPPNVDAFIHMAVHPDGSYWFIAWDNNTSFYRLYRWDVKADNFTLVHSVDNTNQGSYFMDPLRLRITDSGVVFMTGYAHAVCFPGESTCRRLGKQYEWDRPYFQSIFVRDEDGYPTIYTGEVDNGIKKIAIDNTGATVTVTEMIPDWTLIRTESIAPAFNGVKDEFYYIDDDFAIYHFANNKSSLVYTGIIYPGTIQFNPTASATDDHELIVSSQGSGRVSAIDTTGRARAIGSFSADGSADRIFVDQHNSVYAALHNPSFTDFSYLYSMDQTGSKTMQCKYSDKGYSEQSEVFIKPNDPKGFVYFGSLKGGVLYACVNSTVHSLAGFNDLYPAHLQYSSSKDKLYVGLVNIVYGWFSEIITLENYEPDRPGDAVRTHLYYPASGNGMTLDEKNDRLYVWGGNLNYVNASDPDKFGLTVVLSQTDLPAEITGMAIHPVSSEIYLAFASLGKIYKYVPPTPSPPPAKTRTIAAHPSQPQPQPQPQPALRPKSVTSVSSVPSSPRPHPTSPPPAPKPKSSSKTPPKHAKVNEAANDDLNSLTNVDSVQELSEEVEGEVRSVLEELKQIERDIQERSVKRHRIHPRHHHRAH